MLRLVFVSLLLIFSPIFSQANPVVLAPVVCTGPQGILCLGVAGIVTIGVLSTSQEKGNTKTNSKTKASERVSENDSKENWTFVFRGDFHSLELNAERRGITERKCHGLQTKVINRSKKNDLKFQPAISYNTLNDILNDNLYRNYEDSIRLNIEGVDDIVDFFAYYSDENLQNSMVDIIDINCIKN